MLEGVPCCEMTYDRSLAISNHTHPGTACTVFGRPKECYMLWAICRLLETCFILRTAPGLLERIAIGSAGTSSLWSNTWLCATRAENVPNGNYKKVTERQLDQIHKFRIAWHGRAGKGWKNISKERICVPYRRRQRNKQNGHDIVERNDDLLPWIQ